MDTFPLYSRETVHDHAGQVLSGGFGLVLPPPSGTQVVITNMTMRDLVDMSCNEAISDHPAVFRADQDAAADQELADPYAR